METVDREFQDQSSLTAANMSLAVLAASFIFPAGIWPSAWGAQALAQEMAYEIRALPDQAQIIDQRAFNVLAEVPPPDEANSTTVREFQQFRDHLR